MVEVFLGLGSNIEPRRHLGRALRSLDQVLQGLSVSPAYESEAVGFSGANFLNLVARGYTTWPVVRLQRFLKFLERQNGRRRGGPKFASRTLDIDLLVYGQLSGRVAGVELPRPEIYYNAFVFRPFCDLNPHWRDPLSGRPLHTARRYPAFREQSLWPVGFTFRHLARASTSPCALKIARGCGHHPR